MAKRVTMIYKKSRKFAVHALGVFSLAVAFFILALKKLFEGDALGFPALAIHRQEDSSQFLNGKLAGGVVVHGSKGVDVVAGKNKLGKLGVFLRLKLDALAIEHAIQSIGSGDAIGEDGHVDGGKEERFHAPNNEHDL
jgi:hypothetical protein